MVLDAATETENRKLHTKWWRTRIGGSAAMGSRTAQTDHRSRWSRARTNVCPKSQSTGKNEIRYARYIHDIIQTYPPLFRDQRPPLEQSVDALHCPRPTAVPVHPIQDGFLPKIARTRNAMDFTRKCRVAREFDMSSTTHAKIIHTYRLFREQRSLERRVLVDAPYCRQGVDPRPMA